VPIFGNRSDKPILAVDVDGVISLFGFEEGMDNAPGEYRLVDGILHCISLPTGGMLNRLAQTYDLIWATGWEDRANDHLPGILGVPTLPFLTFDGRARFGTAHWKLEALQEYAGDRPLAWVDDSLDQSCHDWADSRPAPTLLVQTESTRGLEEGHVAALESWAQSGYAPR